MLQAIKRMGVAGTLRLALEGRLGAGPVIQDLESRKSGLQYIRELGRGKDGLSLLVRESDDSLRVHKILSDYGRSFLVRTLELFPVFEKLDWFFPLRKEEHGFSYPWEELEPPAGYTRDFLGVVDQVCRMQMELVAEGWVYWDLGSGHSNYLMTRDGALRVIDYGGNAFLPLHHAGPRPALPCWRANVLSYNAEFVRLQLLLHICEFALGELHARTLRMASQYGATGVRRGIDWTQRRLRGTPWEQLTPVILQMDPRRPDDWRTLAEQAAALAQDDSLADLQEEADIDSVELREKGVTVEGYQAYSIDGKEIAFASKGNLWDTRQKAEIVDTVLSKLRSAPEFRSMLDIGSNLGAYVFLAGVRYDLPRCIGVDYNGKYIETCTRIADHMGLSNCQFRVGRFSEEDERVSLTLALGLVHHLYQRTETFGSLGDIVAHLASTCTHWLLVEFPDENDNKAGKWTRMPGRASHSPYTKAEFEARLGEHFARVEAAGNIGPTRHFYLCSKQA